MSDTQLPEGFNAWDFSHRLGPAATDPSTVVEVVLRNGDITQGSVDSIYWENDGMAADIVGWRVLDAELHGAAPDDGPHPHAELMLEYAQDALITRAPWRLWQFRVGVNAPWEDCSTGPSWVGGHRYRRKPVQIPTQTINGFTVPRGWAQPLANKSPYYIASLEASDWNSYCEWS